MNNSQLFNDNPEKTILVWDWEDAPPELKELSPHGGDEDWVALVPHGLRETSPVIWELLERGGNDVSVSEISCGKVYIAAHS